MGVFKVGNDPLFGSTGGTLRVGLFGPAWLGVAIRDSVPWNELRKRVAGRAAGTLTLDGDEWNFQLRGLSEGAAYGEAHARRVYGAVATHDFMEWLDRPAVDAESGKTLFYQRGLEENIGAFLKRVGQDENAGIEFMPGGREEEILFPPFGGCLFRSGLMTNRAFLNLVVGAVSAKDSRMLGWRAIGMGKGKIALLLAAGNDETLPDLTDNWEILTGTFGETGTDSVEAPLRLRCRRKKGERYLSLGKVMENLFGNPVPKDRAFGGGVEGPAVPQWVTFQKVKWFVSEVLVKFSERDDGKETMIDDVEMVLTSRPPSPPVEGRGMDTCVIDAVVTGWNEEGDMLNFKPPDGGDWKVAGETHGFGGGELGGRFVIPGGGLYLQPAKDDRRIVILAQGQVPISPGVVVRKAEDLKDEDIVIQSSGTQITLGEDSISVVVKETFDVSKG